MTKRVIEKKLGRRPKTKEQKDYDFKTAQQIRKYLDEVGINQVQLAEELNMSEENLSKLLNGETYITIFTYERIIDILGRKLIVIPKMHAANERNNQAETERFF